jgi:site-specific DNA recombinase
LDKIAIYARRSEEKETGESIQNQINTCKNYVKSIYKSPHIDEYCDDDYSGRNMNRPNFIKMMKLVKEGYYSAVVFWKLDRVARNALDFLALHKELDKIGVNLVSVTEGFDPSTPAGKLMMTMLAAVAEMERKNISQRVVANMNEMAKQGRWTGGVIPYGYKVVDKYLCEDEKTIKIVKSIFEKYLETHSLFAVSKWLKVTYNISKQPTSIKRILSNLVYVKSDNEIYRYLNSREITLYGELNGNGLISYGKANKTKEESVEFRTAKEWIVAIGKHKGIITGLDYIHIQKILESKNNSGRRGTGEVSFLNGLCRCAYCNSYMRTKQKKGGYRYFACGKKDTLQSACDNKLMKISYVEELVIHKLENLNVEDLIINFQYNDTTPSRKELDKKKDQIKKLIETLSFANDLEEVLLDKIRELKKEVTELELLIDEKEKENLLLDANRFSKDEYIEKLKNFKNSFKNYKTNQDKRNILKHLIKCVYIDGNSKEIRLEVAF